MWYRVEFNRDGSIRDAKEVEGRGSDSGLVVYVDAENTALAVANALSWRTRYLEAARRNAAAHRKRMARIGICRSCRKRSSEPGKRACSVCNESDALRRKQKYTISTSAPASPQTVAAVREQIVMTHGTVASAIRGEPVSVYIAAPVARALRTTGADAEASIRKNGEPLKRGGRYSLNEVELELLRLVRTRFGQLNSTEFEKWVSDQISVRERRQAEETKPTAEVA